MAGQGKGQDKRAKSKQPPTGPNVATASGKPPSWPIFRPALPVVDLELTAPAPELVDKVFVVNTFFPTTLCRNYVTFFRGLPLTTTPGRPKRGEAIRVNDRYQVDDPAFAEKLWSETGLQDVLLSGDHKQPWGGQIVGLNPNIRIYRYTKNQWFGAHYDDSQVVSCKDGSETITAKTTWTLLLYLTSSAEGCVGGQTVFYPRNAKTREGEIAIELETGMLLLHKHGNDCLLVKLTVVKCPRSRTMLTFSQHEGREVLEGEKWVIRTDLCVKL